MSWFQVVSVLYLSGMLSVLLVRLVQIARMGLVMRGGSLWKQQEDGITIYCHSDDVAPFSWLNSIVISQSDRSSWASFCAGKYRNYESDSYIRSGRSGDG